MNIASSSVLLKVIDEEFVRKHIQDLSTISSLSLLKPADVKTIVDLATNSASSRAKSVSQTTTNTTLFVSNEATKKIVDAIIDRNGDLADKGELEIEFAPGECCAVTIAPMTTTLCFPVIFLVVQSLSQTKVDLSFGKQSDKATFYVVDHFCSVKGSDQNLRTSTLTSIN